MFCYQCEQTYRGQGCVETRRLRQRRYYGNPAGSACTRAQRRLHVCPSGASEPAPPILESTHLWSRPSSPHSPTSISIRSALHLSSTRAATVREQARRLYERACQTKGAAPEMLAGPAVWTPAASIEGLIKQGKQALISERTLAVGPEIANLQELITYGIKGVVAYAATCEASWRRRPRRLRDNSRDSRFPYLAVSHRRSTACDGAAHRRTELPRHGTARQGQHRIARTSEPTRVRVHPRKGKAIVVSGHDLADLHVLLKQTEGSASRSTHTAKCCRRTAIRS